MPLLALSFFLPALADTGAGGGEPPEANAGVGLLASVGDTVILNGSASSDPEGAGLGYFWTQSGGPEVSLKAESSANPEFTIESAGTYRFELIVSDGYQDSEPDSVEIAVAEQSFGGSAESGCAAAWGLLPVLGLSLLVRRGRKA